MYVRQYYTYDNITCDMYVRQYYTYDNITCDMYGIVPVYWVKCAYFLCGSFVEKDHRKFSSLFSTCHIMSLSVITYTSDARQQLH